MTREEASEELKQEFEIFKNSINPTDWENPNEELRKIIEANTMAIEVLEQTRWIPVSEELPKTNEDVLVYDGAYMFVAWYSRNEIRQGWASYNSQFDGRYTPIRAWMPLPKPYKAEREEKE